MKLIDLLVSRLIERANATLAIVLSLALIAASGLSQIAITPDNRAFYGVENENYQDLLRFEDKFDVNSVVAFAIHYKTPIIESLRFREALSWLEFSSPNIKNFVKSTSLSSLSQAFSVGDELLVTGLLDYVCGEVCSPELVNLLKKEKLVGRLVSPDLRTVALYVVVDVDPELVADVTETQRSVEALADEFEKLFPEFELLTTGAVPMMQAFVDTAAADSVTVVGIAFVVILLFLCLALGSFVLGFLLFSTGLLAASVAMGLAGWAGLTINTATSVVPIVVFTLVVAGAMHLVVHYLQRMADIGGDAKTNLRASFLAQLTPMFLATLTSAVSLLSLYFVTSPPIRELGTLSAIGVVAGFVLSFLFLGLLLPKVKASPHGRVHSYVRRFLNDFARNANGHLWLTVATVFSFLVAIAGLTQLRIDDDFIRYFDEGVSFRADVERMMVLGVGSPYHIEIILSSADDGTIFEPQVLDYSRELTGALRDHNSVLNVTSIVDVLDEVAAIMEIDLEEAFSSPDITNQLFLAYELGLPSNSSSTAFVDSSRTNLRFSVLLKDVSSSETQAIERRIYADHESGGPEGTRILVTGENIPVAHLSADNIGDMLKGLGPVVVIVAGLFALLTRRLLLFGVGLLAIVIPIAAGFGLWAWGAGEIGLAATIVLAITIGVVIDDAIHILYRYEASRSELSLNAPEAASYAVHKAGPAVVITSICLSIGFILLLFSAYAVNQVFGIVACLIFALAMLFDLIVLPKLLAWRRLT